MIKLKWRFLAAALIGTVFLFYSLLVAAQINITARVPGQCGNNIKEFDEQCDGTDLGGASCGNLGFSGGTLTCNTNCTFNTSQCISGGGSGGGGGGGGGGVSIIPTSAVLIGKAYPKSSVTILVDGSVKKTIQADSEASFNVSVEAPSGIRSFSLYATDPKGRRSLTYSFTISLTAGAVTTVSGIFLAPTIDVDKSEVRRGDILNILGQTAPSSTVTIFISSEEEIKRTVMSGSDGFYFLAFNTGILDFGDHTAKSQASFLDTFSIFSQSVKFKVGTRNLLKILPVDLNQSGTVNVVDFSILLFHWGKKTAASLETADINKDGRIDIKDLSIMLFYWTG